VFSVNQLVALWVFRAHIGKLKSILKVILKRS